MTVFNKAWIFLKNEDFDASTFEASEQKMRQERMAGNDDPVTEGRMQPMAKVNPNVPTEIQEGNTQPDMDPSWTPEAIARINAENDVSRRALEGE